MGLAHFFKKKVVQGLGSLIFLDKATHHQQVTLVHIVG